MKTRAIVYSLGTFALSLLGFSSLFVVGYMGDVPHEAFLVFGKQLSLSVGLEAGFQAAFTFITAKIFLILVAVSISFVGDTLSGFSSPKIKNIAKSTDNLTIKIALAPMKVVLIIACFVYYFRFLRFSLDAFLIIGGWAIFGSILFEVIDRIFLRSLRDDPDENGMEVLNRYDTSRLLLFATLLSGLAYSTGIAAARQVMLQEPRFVSEKLDEPGIIFGANDVALLVVVPGKVNSTKMLGFIENREPRRWIMLPFAGQPVVLW